MPYEIAVEHEDNSRYWGDLESELTWAIQRAFTGGVKSIIVSIPRADFDRQSRELRLKYTEHPPRWTPESLEVQPSQWLPIGLLRVCVGNAAIRAREVFAVELRADSNRVRVVDHDNPLYVTIEITFQKQDAPALIGSVETSV